MEIASVLPFGVAAVEAGCAQRQPPEEPFCDCLGSAVGRKAGKAQPLPPTHADSGPAPSRVEGDREAGAAAEAAETVEIAVSQSSREMTAAGVEPGVARVTEELEDVRSLVANPPAPPAPELPPREAPSPQELAAPVAAAGDTGVAERPRAQQPPPGVEIPLAPPAREPGADQPRVAGAELPATVAETTPEPQVPANQTPAPATLSAGTNLDPAAVAAFQANTAASGGKRPQALTAERAVAAAPVLPSAADPEEAEASSGNAQGADQPSRGRFGAERLWGYWLRHGGGGATRAADFGAELTRVAAAGQRSADAAPPGVESSPWQALMQAASGTGVEPGAGEGAATGPETRAEPTAAGAAPVLGSGAAQGLERTVRAGSPTPRAPSPPPPPPHQIANAVRVAVLRGGNQVTVQLEPETLGKVQVVLVHGDEGVRASFRVENPLTQQTLQADAPQLKQALEARGVNVAHISVELDQGDRQGRDPLARHTRGRRRRIGGANDGEMLLDDVALRAKQWRPWGFEARA